jgi:hypothetical protein
MICYLGTKNTVPIFLDAALWEDLGSLQQRQQLKIMFIFMSTGF